LGGRKGDVRRKERRQQGVKGEEELQWEAGKTTAIKCSP